MPSSVPWRDLARLTAFGVAAWLAVVAAILIGTSVDLGVALTRWDGVWYRSIYDVGYQITDPTYTVQQNVNFFPGGAWTARVLDPVFDPDTLFVVVGLLWGVTAIVAVGLAARSIDREPLVAAVMVVAYPAFFFSFAFYSEGLAIAGSALVVHGLFGRVPLAGFAGGVVTGVARPTVIAAVGAMVVVAYLRGEAERRDVVASLGGLGVGLGAVMLAQHRAGDAFAFTKSQAAWGRELEYPFAALVDEVHRLLTEEFRAGLVWNPIAVLFVMAVLVAMMGASRRGRWPWAVTAYSAVAFLLPVSTSSIGSQIRYMVIVWPVFVFLGDRLTSWTARLVVLAATTPLAVWWIVQFAEAQRFLA